MSEKTSVDLRMEKLRLELINDLFIKAEAGGMQSQEIVGVLAYGIMHVAACEKMPVKTFKSFASSLDDVYQDIYNQVNKEDSCPKA